MAREFPGLPGQEGLAHACQLRAAGWTASAIRRLTEGSGRVLPHVYSRDAAPLATTAQRLAAARLWAGPDALLTGAHAVRLLGLDPPGEPGHFRFLVPGRHHVRAVPEASLVRTARWPRVRQTASGPVASFERALADTARYADFDADALRSLAIDALRERLTTPERLQVELAAGRPNGVRALRLGLRDFVAGAWSLPEAVLGRLLARHGIPHVANPRLAGPGGLLIGVPDAYLPDHAIAVQVHSEAHHAGRDADHRDRWERTVEGDAAFLAHGVLVVGVAPTTLRDHPERFLATLAGVVAAASGRPLPAVTWSATLPISE